MAKYNFNVLRQNVFNEISIFKSEQLSHEDKFSYYLFYFFCLVNTWCTALVKRFYYLVTETNFSLLDTQTPYYCFVYFNLRLTYCVSIPLQTRVVNQTVFG